MRSLPYITVIIISLQNLAFANFEVFNHAFHAKGQKLSCVGCHSVGKKVSKKMCHSCHAEKKTVMAPLNCRQCHQNLPKVPLLKVRPQTHDLHDFKSKHGAIALGETSSCLNCHKESTCTQCHNSNRALKKSPHPTHFLRIHGMKAQMGEGSCTSCHSPRTCVKCHQGK
jgi:hypothetical protein